MLVLRQPDHQRKTSITGSDGIEEFACDRGDAVWRRFAAANIERSMVAELNTKHRGSPSLQQVLA